MLTPWGREHAARLRLAFQPDGGGLQVCGMPSRSVGK
jgi:hypothetical protein